MAYSYILFTGNGATTNYSFPFPYLKPEHVKVSVDGVLTSYTYINSNIIKIDPAPLAGKVIEIKRETPKDTPPVNFTDGSVLLEADLDLLALYSTYIAQEVDDATKRVIYQTSTGEFTAQNQRMTNVADPINPQDVVTKNYHDATFMPQMTAQVSAATAQASAAATHATNAGNSATSASNSAGAALAAKQAAELSQTDAATSATTASTKASEASSSAAAALTSKNDASSSASAAATSATSAATSATTATNQANIATTQATSATNQAAVATTKASEASTSATNAAASATAADSSKTAAASSASSASSSASSASTSASTATTKASEASASASSAATSASTATTKASEAVTSATNAATSASNASASASTASTKAAEALASANAAGAAQVAAEAARDQTLSAYDSFDDRYLGTKISDPTVDNDGNALVAGALYFSSSSGSMKVYTGTQWVAAYAALTGALLVANNLSDLNNAATARGNLGLGNVEDKSSATIRGELTSSNVTTALGFTPPSDTGAGASGTWSISITGNAATATTSTTATRTNNLLVSDDSTATGYLVFVSGVEGNQPPRVTSNKLSFNASTGTLVSTAVDDSAGNLRNIPINPQTAAYALVASDNGKCVSITAGGVTVPANVFSAGQVVTLYNNSTANQTITQGSGLTLQWAGQSASTTGNRTLGLYGMVTILFLSATNAVISGSGVS